MFANVDVPPGTVVLVGSGSHLLRSGSSVYAGAWISVVNCLEKRFPNISLCPLPPVLSMNTPGRLYRSSLELIHWFEKVYGNNTKKLGEVWKKLSLLMAVNSDGMRPRSCLETYTLPFPANLDMPIKTVALDFHSEETCPERITLSGANADRELLLTLFEVLNRDFSTRFLPEDNLPREIAQGLREKDDPPHCCVIGASHMKRIIPYLEAKGIKVIDMSRPGWVASAKNVTDLSEYLKSDPLPDKCVICLDVSSNSVYKFRQYDDSLSMPCKLNDKWHMMGDVVPVSDEGVGDIFRKTMPILEALKGFEKIIIPPIPRYVFGGCCSDPTHCTNVSDPEHHLTMLFAHSRIRNTMKKQMLGTLSRNFRILDILGALTPPGQTSQKQHSEALKRHSHTDNVHLTDRGYELITDSIIKELQEVTKNKIKPALNTNMPRTRDWLGFVSTTGVGANVRHSLLKASSEHKQKNRRAQLMPYFRR